MNVNEVRISNEEDFNNFRSILNDDVGWDTSYSRNQLIVKTKWTDLSRIKMIKVRIMDDNLYLSMQ